MARINGGNGNDTLVGDINGVAEADDIRGNAGDDILRGRGGADKLTGGDGNDELDGGDANDDLDGGAGNDRLFGGAANDRLRGGVGADLLDGGTGDDNLGGDDGDDRLDGGSGLDIMAGGAGNDTMDGGAGIDTMTGGAGIDQMAGGDGDDTIAGDDQNDVLSGGNGNDRLTGGRNDDLISGGDGVDTAVYTGARAQYTITWDAAASQWLVRDNTANRDGVDRLDGTVEILRFTDQSFTLSPPAQTNLRPDAINDAFITPEAAPITGNLLANNGLGADTDKNAGTTLRVTHVGGTAVAATGVTTITLGIGSLEISATGAFTFTPNAAQNALGAGQSRTQTFTYTLSDGSLTDTAIVSMSIRGENDAPTAAAESYSTTEDVAVTGNLLANDTDPDANAILTAQLVSGAANGSVTLAANGAFVYTPNANYFGPDSFTYRASDGLVQTAPVTVNINVSSVNDAPIALAVTGTASEDGPAMTVSASFADADLTDTHTFVVDAGGLQGGVVNNNDGTFTYSPNGAFETLAAGESITDTFSYTVTDNSGASSTSTVTVTINGANDAPDAVDDVAATDEDTPVVIDVLANDTDVDAGATKTITHIDGQAAVVGVAIALSTGGTATLNGGGTISYAPADNANGQKTFNYTLSDGSLTDTATVTVDVTPVNDAPVAAAVTGSTSEDGPSVTVLASFADVDAGDAHTYAIDAGSVLGSVLNNNDGTFNYSPDGAFETLAAGESVTDTFSYTVTDTSGVSSTSTVTVTINGANDAPDAVDDAAATDEDTPVVIDVLANDTDVDAGATKTITHIDGQAVVVGMPVALVSGGAATLNGNGTISYTAGSNVNGQKTFSYTVSDGLASDTATVTVDITPVNDAPYSQNQTFTIAEDAGIGSGVYGYDVDGDDLDFALEGPVVGGEVLFNEANGTFSFTPDTDFNGVASFQYTVTDGQATSAPYSITFNVTPVNDAPVAAAVTGSASEDGPSVTVLASFSDVDAGDSHTYAVDAAGALGSVVNNNDGTFTYNPDGAFETLAAGESATDTFAYTVTDAAGAASTNTVTITITGQNDAPAASAYYAPAAITELPDGHPNELTSTQRGEAYIYFRDADASDTHTVTVTPNGAGYIGTTSSVQFNTGNPQGRELQVFLTAPNAAIDSLAEGQTLVQSYGVAISDPSGATLSQTVEYQIVGANDAPVVTGPVAGLATEDGAGVTLDALANASDVDTGTALSVVDVPGALPAGVTYNPATRSFTLNPANAAYQSLAAGATTSVSVAYGVSDGIATSPASVSWTVTGTNDAPIIGGTSTGTVTEDTVTSVSGALTISDADAGQSSFQPQSGIAGAYGSLNINAAGNWTYFLNNSLPAVQALNVGQSLADMITVQSADGTSRSIGISIQGANDGGASFQVTVITGVYQWGFTDHNALSAFGNLNNVAALSDVNRILTDDYIFAPGGGTNFALVNGIYNFQSASNTIEMSLTAGATLVSTVDFISSRSYGSTGITITGLTTGGVWVSMGSTSSGALGVTTGAARAYAIDVADTLVTAVRFTYSGEQLSIHEIAFNKPLGAVVAGATDPVILDLNGDGVHFGGAVNFDLGADGTAETLVWTSPQDGLLVMDLDGSGAIENGREVLSEVFDGFGYGSSMEALRSLDTNIDGKVDAIDERFAELRVWRDANSDGLSQAEELLSFDELGIESISVAETVQNSIVDGQQVYATGTFAYADGDSGDYSAVYLSAPATEEMTAQGGEETGAYAFGYAEVQLSDGSVVYPTNSALAYQEIAFVDYDIDAGLFASAAEIDDLLFGTPGDEGGEMQTGSLSTLGWIDASGLGGGDSQFFRFTPTWMEDGAAMLQAGPAWASAGHAVAALDEPVKHADFAPLLHDQGLYGHDAIGFLQPNSESW